jgi:RNA polymerase sigma factor (TIGR02999 family)
VHETFLRLAAQKLPEWESRSHFFGVAAHLMRQVLIDHARRIRRAKRGGGERAASLDEAVNAAMQRGQELLALDDALSTLACLDPRKAEIIERRYFGGFTRKPRNRWPCRR